MADLPFELASRLLTADLRRAFLRVVDPAGKIAAAVDALAPVAGRDVVVLDLDSGYRVRQLVERGASVTALVPPGEVPPVLDALSGVPISIVTGTPDATDLPDASADVVVSFWSGFLGPDERQIAEAERLLRPGGRLAIVHDYGRDDVCDMWRPAFLRQVEWSRRNGPFLSLGFRIRVVHSIWDFESMEEARQLLGEAFGETGLELAERMKRPRLEYNVAVYHRSRAGATEGRRLVATSA